MDLMAFVWTLFKIGWTQQKLQTVWCLVETYQDLRGHSCGWWLNPKVYHNKTLPLFFKAETLHTARAWYHFSTFLWCPLSFVTCDTVTGMFGHQSCLYHQGGHMWCALCMLSDLAMCKLFHFRSSSKTLHQSYQEVNSICWKIGPHRND